MVQFHATTICAVRRGPDDICIGGDGQVTMGETAIMKNGAKKVKKIYAKQETLAMYFHMVIIWNYIAGITYLYNA